MIRALIFDCFGVLYVDPGLAFYEEQVPQVESIKEQLFAIIRQYDLGFLSYSEKVQQIAELTGLSAEVVRRGLVAAHTKNTRLLDFAASMRGEYKIGVLSNIGKGGMEPYFTSVEQAELFDYVLTSADVGIVKPDERIFRLAAEHLGVETDECIMIDDRLENCAGAKAAGMEAILFGSSAQTIADIEQIISLKTA